MECKTCWDTLLRACQGVLRHLVEISVVSPCEWVVSPSERHAGKLEYGTKGTTWMVCLAMLPSWFLGLFGSRSKEWHQHARQIPQVFSADFHTSDRADCASHIWWCVQTKLAENHPISWPRCPTTRSEVSISSLTKQSVDWRDYTNASRKHISVHIISACHTKQ